MWLGSRRREQLVSDADLDRLRAVADLRIRQAEPAMDAEEVIAATGDACVVIGTWGAPSYTAEVLAGCPSLRLFAQLGGSVRNSIDPSAWDRGVAVVTAVNAQGRLLADLTLALILAGLHRLPFYVRQQWSGAPLDPVVDDRLVPQRTLIAKPVGLLGFGSIARHLTRHLRSFDCPVATYDPYVDDEVLAGLGVSRAERVDELCARSEVLSVHAAHTGETSGLLDAAALARLPHGALVVNTSYGELIDRPALEQRLREGSLFACLDMVDGDMPSAFDALRYYPTCMITPTISGRSDGVLMMGAQIVDEVLRFLAGQPLAHAVDAAQLATRA